MEHAWERPVLFLLVLDCQLRLEVRSSCFFYVFYAHIDSCSRAGLTFVML